MGENRMLVKLASRIALGAGVVIGCGLIFGCGNTDGGNAGTDQFPGNEYVATGDGSIQLSVQTSSMSVSDTSDFTVTVLDQNGNGVPNVEITCDSEQGVAIIEPTTGTEGTSSTGHMSGEIGCAEPGSFLFECRLPTGANSQVSTTILCAGPTPPGFDGFPGSAGGTLGTGTSPGTGGVTGGGSAAITQVSFDDGFGLTSSIDTTEDECVISTSTSSTSSSSASSSTSVVPEPFFDTYVYITVDNATDQSIQFTSYSYDIPGLVQSENIAFSTGSTPGGTGTASSGYVNANTSVTLSSLFAIASDGQKYFINSAGNPLLIPSNVATQINITLNGTNSNGQTVTATASTIAHFADFNHCSAVGGA